MVSKLLSRNINSYDLLKSFAVIIMIIDHVGSYVFVDSDVLRSIGRIGFPVWFFLAGYSKSRNIPKILWLAALSLIVVDILLGKPIFPLNALFTIIFIRLIVDYILNAFQKNYIQFWVISIYLALLIYPTGVVFEYGTMAFITALYGCLVRNVNGYFEKKAIISYMIFSFVCFIVYMQVSFDFNILNMVVMTIGTLLVRVYLLGFKLKEYQNLTSLLPKPIKLSLQYMGSNTLQIYVIHLIILKIYYLMFINEGYWKPLSFQL